MAQILKLPHFNGTRPHEDLADIPSALDAIAGLAAALDAFAVSVKVFGECLHAEKDASKQDRMLEAWNTVTSGLGSLITPSGCDQ